MSSTAQQGRSERDSATGRLLRAYRSDGDIRARDRLVTLYLPLVETFAHRYRRPGAEYDDLVQAGSIGLLNAIERYDPARGGEFAAYAVPTVVGEIKRHIRDRSAVVRLPRALQEAAARLPREREHLTAQLGREPTAEELAAALRIEPIDLARLREPAPLPDHPDAGERADDGVDLAGAFDVLDEDERAAVYLLYVRDLDQGAAAKQLGISVRQLARRTDAALAKLRAEMERAGAPLGVSSPGGHAPRDADAPAARASTAPAPADAPAARASTAPANPPGDRASTDPTPADPPAARRAEGRSGTSSKKPNGHSGRLLLRMPKPLHARLARTAEREQVSLNQLIVNRLSAEEPSASSEPRWLHTALIVNAVLLALAAIVALVLLVQTL